jgi:hypothetical protein
MLGNLKPGNLLSRWVAFILGVVTMTCLGLGRSATHTAPTKQNRLSMKHLQIMNERFSRSSFIYIFQSPVPSASSIQWYLQNPPVTFLKTSKVDQKKS